jgi:hypothetical protein
MASCGASSRYGSSLPLKVVLFSIPLRSAPNAKTALTMDQGRFEDN